MKRVDALKCYVTDGRPLIFLSEKDIDLLTKPPTTGDAFQDAINDGWAKTVKEQLKFENETFREIFMKE